MPLKEIKTKPEGGKPKLLESAAKAPKTAMKDLWLKSKEKSISELKETPFASQQGESFNAPANTAGDQMLSGMETAAKKGADLTYRGSKKLAQTTDKKVREKREIARIRKRAEGPASQAASQTGKAAKSAASKIKTKNAVVKGVKGKPAKAVKTANRTLKGAKQGAKSIKTAQRSAKVAQRTAQATAKAARTAAHAARAAAKATATGVKAAVKVTATDENGNEVTSTETVTETILEITIIHKTPEEMARQYSFNDRQNEYLALMTEPENENLWAELLGGYVSGGGQIIDPNTNWEGTGIFQWPLPQSYTITSWFGYRADPFTGEIDYHSGTDIGAPGGTPILAAADGTVTIANGIDSWGGGYGYYIKVRHNDTYETLYAHCSSICVVAGQEVKQGEVIGYVGTTGNSTGNHLHFEVWQNGQRTDALSFFRAKG